MKECFLRGQSFREFSSYLCLKLKPLQNVTCADGLIQIHLSKIAAHCHCYQCSKDGLKTTYIAYNGDT